MILNYEDYKSKVLGCWMGKNIGGTLGAPFEFKRQFNSVSFFTQNLSGEPIPNDDLDIQLLWLIALEERGIDIDSRVMSDYWQLYVTPHWAEYGTAKINMKSGLLPPNSGTENNDYKHSNGSFIRSEIWACISPGFPRISANYAYEDAIIDHGNGEGVYAEVFFAAMESAAFVENDIDKLIHIGLSYIPEECAVSCAVKTAVEAYRSGSTWQETRDKLLSMYRGWGFVSINDDVIIDSVSQDDHKKGFADGKRGYDVPVNAAIVIVGLLYGQGDFDKSICTAVNCGEDTDCTAATLGSIYGILYGIDAIPENWKEPIGRKIRTACLNLGELGVYGDQLPADIDNLTDRIYTIAQQIILRNKLPIEISRDKNTDLSDKKERTLFCGNKFKSVYNYANGPVFRFDFFNVIVDYCEGTKIKDNTPKKILVTIENKYKIQEMLNLQWYSSGNWTITPSDEGKIYIAQSVFHDSRKRLEFHFSTEKVRNQINRFVLELTLEGRNTVMLVPVVLLNGNISEI